MRGPKYFHTFLQLARAVPHAMTIDDTQKATEAVTVIVEELEDLGRRLGDVEDYEYQISELENQLSEQEDLLKAQSVRIATLERALKKTTAAPKGRAAKSSK